MTEKQPNINLINESANQAIPKNQIIGFTLQSKFINRAFDTLSVDLFGGSEDVDLEEIRRITRPGSLMRFQINESDQFLGRITDRDTSDQGVIQISCSDYRAELLNSYVDPSVIVNQGENLEKAALRICQPWISSIDNNGFNSQRQRLTGGFSEIVKPEFDAIKLKVPERPAKGNESVWQMLMKFCERSGCLILPSNDIRVLVLAKPEYNQEPLFKLVRNLNGYGNNVVSGSMKESYGEIPTVYIELTRFSGQTRGLPIKGSGTQYDVFGDKSIIPAGQTQKVREVIYGNGSDEEQLIWEGRRNSKSAPLGNKLYRPRYVETNESKTALEAEKLMLKELSSDLQNTLQLTYKIAGFTQNNVIWSIDTIADVYDELLDIKEQMYIEGRTFNYSDSGAVTTLNLIQKNTFFL